MEIETARPQGEDHRSDSIWLILGLGNPGPEYADTFHNVGFRVLAAIAEKAGVRVNERFAGALISDRTVLGGQRVVLVAPQTYMNRSGLVLPRLFERFDTAIGNTIVIYDDLALPLGKIRIRQKGSAGGHNGLKSLISCAGSDEFFRVRVGIHPGRDVGDVRDFVLSKVGKRDRELLERAEEVSVGAVETLLAMGLEKAMATYNGIDLRNEETTEG